MKNRFLCGVIALVTLATGLMAGPREAQWKDVESAMRKGLPKTAIEELQSIIEGAKADKSVAEAIKAIGLRIALEGEIEGNKPEERIVRMQAELEKATPEMKPAMESILAHWYWQYFDQNRWRFMQRTQTAAAPGQDLLSWDLGQILAEINRHFDAALSYEKELKATPISDYNDLFREGTVPDRYRPTLFDFVAYDALQFYQAGEQGSVKAEDAFELDAGSPIFGDTDSFTSWNPATDDTGSPELKAIRIFQAILRFHEADADRSAYYDADLARITFGHNSSTGEDKVERYKGALRRFIDATAGHEASSRALAVLAAQVNEEGDPAKAREIAKRGLDAAPRSAGAAMCFNLIQEIEAKSARMTTEHVWNAPWPTVDVTYRNVTKVYFRAVRMEFTDYLERTRWNFGSIDATARANLLVATPDLEWSSELPPTRDFKERTERLPAPTTLRPGFYFIIASYDPSFREGETQVSAASIWVSDLALVLQMRFDSRMHGGLVVKADSGEPVAGASVRIWARENSGGFREVDGTRTDENGQFHFSGKENTLVVLVESDGHAVSNEREIYSYTGGNAERPDSMTEFFTDRSIYRPGQTISFKGVSLRYDQDKATYSVIPNREVTVVFKDPNGKEIARSTHRSNDYGSFSGVFTAPHDRLTGQMTIQVLGGAGATSVRVEEYKRPKFQVEVSPPAAAAKLASPVVLSIRATAYTGSAIGGAKVKWRVTRGVRLPYWCWWWRPPAIKAIAHGTAETDQDGSFKVQFTAEADPSVPADNEPTFQFSVHADVTDTTGETRSADREVRVGYTALEAALSSDVWQTPEKPVSFKIETSSLDGDPQAAEGVVTVYALRQPPRVEREALNRYRTDWIYGAGEQPKPDPANPDSWEIGPSVASRPFKTDATGKTDIETHLEAGIYQARLETKDRFGNRVTARQTVEVLDPGAKRFAIRLPNILSAPKWSVEPGETFKALWGTGYDTGRAFVELECNGRPLRSFWTASSRTQELIELPVTEEMRGGVSMRVTFVRENRAYLNQAVAEVPWSNKQLTLKWERFRSKLMPGQKETWTAVVTGPDARAASAEMVACLYDASLDQYQRHDWPRGFGVFRQESITWMSSFQNTVLGFQPIYGFESPPAHGVFWTYRSYPTEVVNGPDAESTVLSPFVLDAAEEKGTYRANSTLAGTRVRTDLLKAEAGAHKVITAQFLQSGESAAEPDLGRVTARRNLSETAFFMPQLIAGGDGVVEMVFTMPEALTEWRFLGFAHDKDLRAGFFADRAVTAKDLMVEPNPPRFLREGDRIEFTVKVSNTTDTRQSGKVRLTFSDAATLKPADGLLGINAPEQAFDVPARQSRTFSWPISVPDGTGFLTYKAVGASSKASDGEEGNLPVLSRRILVTESLPLPINGKATKQFEFRKLLDSGPSDTLRSQSLTVQMVSQPAWYAVMALPYLMEYPYECSEQVFNRLYANTLARHIANSDPKIRRIFDLWKGTSALDSPLEKNSDLKSLALEETPWLREATDERQARQNVGLLFDSNRLDGEYAKALRQLSDRQLPNGLWSWFPGGPPSQYISLYITTGFGRLRHLGVDVDTAPAVRSLDALDEGMDEQYRRIRRSPRPEEYVPTCTDALYLYGRSFFLKDRAISPKHEDAVEFYLRQSRLFWLKTACRQSQAQLALALQRFGDKETPQAILLSIKERSVSDEELGMFWRDQEEGWWWYRAPIETQAMMIEALDEVSGDSKSVEACKVWLLKQKQTQSWSTTKATADAIYALLLHGNNLLASDARVEVDLGGEPVRPGKVEAGTGFYEQKFVGGEIKPRMGAITVRKVDDGVSWGSIHWQYLEDIGKVTAHEGTPLKLKKALFVRENTARGPVLKPVTGPLSVGDELVVRIELRTDRDMEYVHLKDQRGSGTEPVDVLSGYRFQDGLAYYESTRDTASSFFIDYLPKGAYVFEYSTRVQLRGSYQTGIAEIQCMYAPEFNSHSESVNLEVK